jgi:hypothetical protein
MRGEGKLQWDISRLNGSEAAWQFLVQSDRNPRAPNTVGQLGNRNSVADPNTFGHSAVGPSNLKFGDLEVRMQVSYSM